MRKIVLSFFALLAAFDAHAQTQSFGPGLAGSANSIVVGNGGISLPGLQYQTAVVVSSPTTGGTVTYAAAQQWAQLTPAGTLATLTITLPACAASNNGDVRGYSTTQIVTALTIGASAGSVAGAATTLAVGAGHAYRCNGGNTTWYQIF